MFQTNQAYQQVKEKLIRECNLQTVVSLPPGVFLPYSAVKTSVLFFDKASQTKDIWFYEAGLLETKKLTKKSGISDQHFADLLKVYKKRPESDRSWLIPVQKIIDSGFNISAGHYNPHGPEQEDLLEPQEYAAQIKELLKTAMQNVDELMKELKT